MMIMLQVTLELTEHALNNEITGLSRGHITLEGSDGRASSRGKMPDQSMMIFISVIDLLDGIRRFILDSKTKTYKFVGAGSSFSFSVTRIRNDHFSIQSGTDKIGTLSRQELVRSIWQSVSQFLERYQSYLSDTDLTLQDLDRAPDQFSKAFDVR